MLNKIGALFLSVAMIGLNRQDLHQPLTDTKLSLETHTSVAQTFNANYDNLNIVSICLRNSSRHQTPLQFALHEATVSAEPIREIVFSGGNIVNDDCTRFQFEPVAESSGKNYVVLIKSTKPEKEFTHSDMYAESFGGKDYIQGQAYLDGVETGTDLHFKTFYRSDLGSTVRESVSQFFVRLIKDLGFFIPYFALLIFIVYRLTRHRK